MRKEVLILFAHPALEKSRVNRILIQGLDQIKHIRFHDLYQTYPDLDIEVKREQELLEAHDVILFMHPFYWYSTPAILKEWQDLVLLHDWAYGSKGNALKGKKMGNVITTGGPQQAYHHEDSNRFTIRQLLTPIEQTARLCKMEYLPPFTIHGTHRISTEEILESRQQLHDYLQNLIEQKNV